MPPIPDSDAPSGLRIFISYSRKDTIFTGLLADRLKALSYIVDFDQSTQLITTGIAPSDHWWVRIQEMIAAADVVVLVVSPDSIRSPMVDEELVYASLLAKRIIALTCRDVDFRTAPARFSALNVNHWFLNLEFSIASAELAHALDRDVEWLRMAARLTSDAKLWYEAPHSADRLLVGQEIVAAELWSTRRPASVPEPSELVLDFIAASRSAQHEQIERTRKQLRRTMRLQWAVSGAIVCVMIATSLGAYFVLDRARELSRARSTVIARAAKQMYASHDYVRALRLAALASRDTVFAPTVPEANDLLVASAQASRLTAAFSAHTGKISDVKFLDGAKTFLSWSEEDQTVRIWDGAAGAELQMLDLWSLNLGPVNGVTFSPLGDRLIVSGENQWQMFEVNDGKFVSAQVGGTPMDKRRTAFSDDGKYLAVSSDGRLTVWDTGNFNKSLLTVDGSDLYEILFSKSGDTLTTWEWSGAIRQWRMTPKPTARPPITVDDAPYGGANGFVISRDGTRAIVLGNQLTVIDLLKSKLQFPPIKIDATIEGAEFSPDERSVLVWTRGSTQPSSESAYQFDSSSGVEIGSAMQNANWVMDAEFSSDGSRLLTLSGDTVSIWNGKGELEPPRLRHNATIAGSTFMRDGRAILTWGDDGIARIWDSETYAGNGAGTRRVRLVLTEIVHGSPITHARLLEHDKKLATVGEDGTIKIWSLEAIPFNTVENHFGIIDYSNKRPLPVSTTADELVEWRPEAVQRLWDSNVRPTDSNWQAFVQQLCNTKLPASSPQGSDIRRIDDTDVEFVPLLQGREEEDVCDWSPSWYEVGAGLISNLISTGEWEKSACDAYADQHFPTTTTYGNDIERLAWPARGDVKFEGDGITIATPAGSSIYAAHNGVVIYAGDGLKEFGSTVLIRGASGLVTVYGYLDKMLVARGMKVRQGDKIGHSGLSQLDGLSKLHFQVRQNQAAANPLPHLEGTPPFCPRLPPTQ